MTRPGAYREVIAMDSNADGQLSDFEQAAYFERIGSQLADAFDIRVNNQNLRPAALGEVALEMPFTKIYRFAVEQPADWQSGAVLAFHNDAFLDAAGQITITIDAVEPVTIAYNSLNDSKAGDQRDLLLRYQRGPVSAAELAIPAVRQPLFAHALSHAAFLPALVLLLTMILVLRQSKSMCVRAPALLICVFAGVSITASALRRQQPTLNEREATRIFQGLHRNIYNAFDAPSQSAVYDALAESLTGAMLEEVYLQVHGSMVAQEDGDVSVQIRRVRPLSSDVHPLQNGGPGFQVRYRWRVIGTITHHAHKHARVNECQALYTVTKDKVGWRISNVEIEAQQRVAY